MDPAKPSFKEALRALARRRERELEAHPAPAQLAAYLDGELAGPELERLRDHLAVCRPCAGLVRDLGALSDLEVPEDVARHLEEDVEAGWEALQNRLRGQQPKERRREGWPLLRLKPMLPFAIALTASLATPVLGAALMAHAFVRIHAKAALLLLGLTGFAGGLGWAVPEGVPIDGAREITERIEGAETHTYRIALRRGDYVQVAVDQKGADVEVTWRDPAGRRIYTYDGLSGSWGIEDTAVIAEEEGEYLIEVEKIDQLESAGIYVLESAEVRPANAEDRLRFNGTVSLARAESLRRANKPEQALPIYFQAFDRWTEAKDGAQQAETLYRMGWIYHTQGELAKALALYQRIESVWHGSVGEGHLLNWIGRAHRDLGESDEAIRYFHHARRIGIEKRLPDVEAFACQYLAGEYLKRGEFRKARDFFDCTKKVWDRHGNPYRRALLSRDLGEFYLTLGQPEQGIQQYRKALQLARQARRADLVAWVQKDLSRAHLVQGDYGEALTLVRQLLDRGGRDAASLNLRGLLELEQGRPEAALPWHEKALQVAREKKDEWEEAQALANLGYIYGTAGNEDRALRYFEDAESSFRGQASLTAVASVHLGRALVLQALGKLNEALAEIEASLELVEVMRSDPASAKLRASFLARRHNVYTTHTDILIDLHRMDPEAGYDARAFESSEAARFRTLLESLATRVSDLPRGAAKGLLIRERLLQSQMRDAQTDLMWLVARRSDDPEIDFRKAQLRELEQELESVREAVRKSDPRLADLVLPQTLTVADVQQKVLDEKTVLLAFTLGKESSLAWLIGRDVLESAELPGEQEIERLARAAYRDLSRPVRRGSGFQTPRSLMELSQTILAPIAEHLEAERLLVVPDGALSYIPFAALPDPRDPRIGRPLIFKSEIVVLPSASVLSVIRRQAAGRRAWPKQVAVLADPVFTSDDPRVRSPLWERWGRTTLAMQGPLNDVLRSARSLGIERLDRLEHSRREAEAILSLVPEGSLAVLGFDATHEAATSPDLARYRIVHFATHGLFNPEFPQLSGIVLSLVDREGRPRDGFLHVSDIYGLDLPVDLVVLSACKTALGEEVRGEGLVGLTRGFLYAGASRVMVSLWSVDDRATADLMERFYAAVLDNGLPPAAALRRAQISMYEAGEWRAPFHWAAFVLEGEWR